MGYCSSSKRGWGTMDPWDDNREGGNTIATNHMKYLWKDVTADNQEQQTCEGNTNHINAIPDGSAIQSQKTDTLEDIMDHLKTKLSKTYIGPIPKTGMRHQQMTWKLVHNTTTGQKQPMTEQLVHTQQIPNKTI